MQLCWGEAKKHKTQSTVKLRDVVAMVHGLSETHAKHLARSDPPWDCFALRLREGRSVALCLQKAAGARELPCSTWFMGLQRLIFDEHAGRALPPTLRRTNRGVFLWSVAR